jgi:peptidoglycan hydrolase CwlO-like protein
MLRILAPTRTVFAALKGGFALAFGCAILLLSVGTGPAAAATLEQKQSAARDRIQQTSTEIEAGRATLEAARQEADQAASKEAGLSSLLVNGQERSSQLAGQLEQAEAALARSKERLSRARRLLADRLVSIYMNGDMPNTLDLALGASNFADLATGATYIESIEDSDSNLAARVADLRHQLGDKVDGIGEAKAAVDRHNAALSSARAQIASVRAEAESSAATLASANAERAGQIDALKSDIAGWQDQIEKQQQVSQQQAEETVEEDLGGPYSIPTYIVMCESGGNYSAVNSSSGAGGAYQIMPSTWEAYGGTGLPQDASKAEQDRIAALIWADSGPGAWSCA